MCAPKRHRYADSIRARKERGSLLPEHIHEARTLYAP
jgi:hypothetical protein